MQQSNPTIAALEDALRLAEADLAYARNHRCDALDCRCCEQEERAVRVAEAALQAADGAPSFPADEATPCRCCDGSGDLVYEGYYRPCGACEGYGYVRLDVAGESVTELESAPTLRAFPVAS